MNVPYGSVCSMRQEKGVRATRWINVLFEIQKFFQAIHMDRRFESLGNRSVFTSFADEFEQLFFSFGCVVGELEL